MSEPTTADLRKFCESLLSWIGPLLLISQAEATVQRKEVADEGWQSKRMANAKSFVTSTDLASQKKILEQIALIWPGHSVLFEEDAAAEDVEKFPTDSDYLWLIDPLDGTRNYAEKKPHFGAILGVLRRSSGRMLAGAIIEPVKQLTFGFAAGGGAFLNGKPFTMRTSAQDASLLLGYQVPPDLENQLTAEGQAIDGALGCAVSAVRRVLLGQNKGLIYNNSDILDVAVPLSIIAEARGKVTDWTGRPINRWPDRRVKTMLATGDALFLEELIEIAEPFAADQSVENKNQE